MIYKNIDLEKLMELMEKYETTEICLKDGKTSIEVKRKGSSQEAMPQFTHSHRDVLISSKSSQQPPPPKEEAVMRDQEEPIETIPIELNIKEITAPLVGTFYRAPAPDANPYVEVGDKIKAGDTLCIVEAMKNMNEIESDINGIVKEICTQNAELVEYGQVLFKIDILG